MPPVHDFDPPIGIPQVLEPGLRRLLAPNPSPMTYRGTNTYLLGETHLAVIDPGPADSDHLAAILDAVQPGQTITHILVSHAHLDHSPLAGGLQDACGAPIYGFGPAEKGRSEVMQALAEGGLVGGGEGIDSGFAPDHEVADGEVIEGTGWRVQAWHTPGHIGNHLCFGYDDVCFTADHVMGWATSLVSPPDGDLTDFMRSCRRLRAARWRRFYPGHGDIVHDPHARLDGLIAHRLAREAAILEALAAGPSDAHELAQQIYLDTPASLMAAATRNVLAHLIDLAGKNRIAPAAPLRADTPFRLL
ncbi:MBL fold metallo-hydrolase [Roseobacter sinensis]|uniref:MBL fold metallo-hydrolase n=1 Tax=Roseobacter sinensis TaxID=2931391 RepID=A0ABT3BF04_9RHOB|nr:MBL fold metallo-hydrolase [Roseobacter sp. WL0113]MCV3271959.1 MBL fold metallo-hydrolase [Roseobacter sp. WL0113]